MMYVILEENFVRNGAISMPLGESKVRERTDLMNRMGPEKELDGDVFAYGVVDESFASPRKYARRTRPERTLITSV